MSHKPDYEQINLLEHESFPRQCFICGRKGTRWFVRYQDSWICKAQLSCELRRARWNRRFRMAKRAA